MSLPLTAAVHVVFASVNERRWVVCWYEHPKSLNAHGFTFNTIIPGCLTTPPHTEVSLCVFNWVLGAQKTLLHCMHFSRRNILQISISLSHLVN